MGCATVGDAVEATYSPDDANVKCRPKYKQVYQPPLKLGEAGRVIQVVAGENCEVKTYTMGTDLADDEEAILNNEPIELSENVIRTLAGNKIKFSACFEYDKDSPGYLSLWSCENKKNSNELRQAIIAQIDLRDFETSEYFSSLNTKFHNQTSSISFIGLLQHDKDCELEIKNKYQQIAEGYDPIYSYKHCETAAIHNIQVPIDFWIQDLIVSKGG